MGIRLWWLGLALSVALFGQAHGPETKPAPASAATAHSTAFDKRALEAYVRHLFVWPASDITLQISTPKPAPIAGFFEVVVRAAKGNASQDEKFYVSKDGQTFFQVQGNFYKISQNPYKEQLSKLKTEFRPSLGTPGAPVIFVAFSDFQCHFCKEEAKTIRENLVKDYPKEVRFYFMDFPLEAVHPWAKTAALAGRCIFRENAPAFWEYHDWIFENQEQITPDNLKDKILEWAKGKDLDGAKLRRCIDTKATEGDVEASLAEGKSLGVNSTPSLFINGRPMPGAVPWPDLKRVIDYEIGYQKTAKNAGEDCGCDLSIPKPGVK